eukprot:3446138-Lingulodinium_polyedra.AAC.1
MQTCLPPPASSTLMSLIDSRQTTTSARTTQTHPTTLSFCEQCATRRPCTAAVQAWAAPAPRSGRAAQP